MEHVYHVAHLCLCEECRGLLWDHSQASNDEHLRYVEPSRLIIGIPASDMPDEREDLGQKRRDWLTSLLADRLRERIVIEAMRPRIVCLCGSTRFVEQFNEANRNLTLKGMIVLSIGCHRQSDAQLFSELADEEAHAIKADLDELHLRKIDLADEVFVINVGGYVGESTAREIAYARKSYKPVRFLEPERLSG